MKNQGKNIEASLLYQAESDPFDKVDMVALRSMIENLGDHVEDIKEENGEHVLLTCRHVQILVIYCGVPFPLKHFEGVMRPSGDGDQSANVFGSLAEHSASLTVLVADRPGVEQEDVLSEVDNRALKTRICWETVDQLIAMTDPALVFWSDDDRLQTIGEFELEVARSEIESATVEATALEEDGSASILDGPVQVLPRRPARSPVSAKRPDQTAVDRIRTRAPKRHGVRQDWTSFANPSRNAIVIPRRPASVVARTKRPDIFATGPHLSKQAIEWLEPQAEEIQDADGPRMSTALSAFLAYQESKDANRLGDSAAGRASLYVMSATIGVFALPLGVTALTYNALSGGSFRHTAHMLALTGFGLALAAMGVPNPAVALTAFL